MSTSFDSSNSDWIADALETLPALVTKQEAARALRVSTRTIARLLARGRLRSLQHTFGGSARVLIPRREVERYLRSLVG